MKKTIIIIGILIIAFASFQLFQAFSSIGSQNQSTAITTNTDDITDSASITNSNEVSQLNPSSDTRTSASKNTNNSSNQQNDTSLTSTDTEVNETSEEFPSTDEVTTPQETSVYEETTSSNNSTMLTKNPVKNFFSGIANNNLELVSGSLANNALLQTPEGSYESSELISIIENALLGSNYKIYRSNETESSIDLLLSYTPNGQTKANPYEVYQFTLSDQLISTLSIRLATSDDLAFFNDKTLENSSLLPLGFTRYLQGVNNDDMDLFLSGFTPSGQVLDVSRLFTGHEEIQAWANREVLFLLYSVGRIEFASESVEVINNIRFNTNSEGFYGSYTFTLSDDELIQYVDMQYSDRQAFHLQ